MGASRVNAGPSYHRLNRIKRRARRSTMTIAHHYLCVSTFRPVTKRKQFIGKELSPHCDNSVIYCRKLRLPLVTGVIDSRFTSASPVSMTWSRNRRMDLYEMSRPHVPRSTTVEPEPDNLVSLPAWQAARTRVEHYLALLDLPQPVHQHWATVAFARALRQRASGESPIRLVMHELRLLIAEHEERAATGDVRRLVTAAQNRRSAAGITRAALRPASLKANLVRRCWARLLDLLGRACPRCRARSG